MQTHTPELIPCIVSGGAGTRLWPVSRQAFPKPFIRLADDQSLLQKAFLRAARLPGVKRVIIITNQQAQLRTLDECRAVNAGELALELLLEPEGRNTAPALAAAAADLLEREPESNPLLLALPADHLIADEAAFAAAVEKAARLAGGGRIVVFGLTPSRAETGFGYIEAGAAIGADGQEVARFVEKPDLVAAEGYLAGGRHLWNSGMFCFSAAALCAELAEHAPDVLAAVRDCLAHSPASLHADHRLRALERERFGRCPDISIDYALMERTRVAAVVRCELGWSDIGNWDSLAEQFPADADGNRVSGDALLRDSHDCFIQSRGRLIAMLGVDNLAVVDTPDALLVADRGRSQEVRELARRLQDQGHPAWRLHLSSQRPWGHYTVLADSERYKIKRIVVKPGAALSLQMHHHRSEHWIVVSGTATVTHGEQERLLHTNESTFIPAGETHRLSNPGLIDLVLIEVQSGEYLGEDDIVRFADDYGRSEAAP
ncbi:mannose-1-phosphate guanylyltransferase [Chromobacterium alkanivorans]|uniref:mannose-1-phosphate guanylyltransferase/mannose-6-phosphate isomerase n=1 Tax=Chromobacterium alkanivorans TaxID=1071719 RepID=UPI002167454A|nr:mannose-1-phosphate guanylyltransferase/mannose-6-phosphate isomerase [Chromobacterium alkanivorans]MCS3805787.1 mannose-1-phosphate guanylyltransferase [Chromobacterium alkanivorans]MCS3819983.1 mannose-1-phosphate guanylyltransferase [Chromobacterium alkanivorans]MCS3874740.1 mannose-1-phosphate guanylyltransferase [Chromobacterium alkanivorans]